MRAVRITWGGKIENNGKRLSENRTIERNISEDMIKKFVEAPVICPIEDRTGYGENREERLVWLLNFPLNVWESHLIYLF